jgi:hypothetical protein
LPTISSRKGWICAHFRVDIPAENRVREKSYDATPYDPHTPTFYATGATDWAEPIGRSGATSRLVRRPVRTSKIVIRGLGA